MIDKKSYGSYIDLECLSYNTLMELFTEVENNMNYAKKKYLREYTMFKGFEFIYMILKEEVERRKKEKMENENADLCN